MHLSIGRCWRFVTQNKQIYCHIFQITMIPPLSLLSSPPLSSCQQCYTGLGFGSHHGSSGGLAGASAAGSGGRITPISSRISSRSSVSQENCYQEAKCYPAQSIIFFFGSAIIYSDIICSARKSKRIHDANRYPLPSLLSTPTSDSRANSPYRGLVTSPTTC